MISLMDTMISFTEQIIRHLDKNRKIEDNHFDKNRTRLEVDQLRASRVHKITGSLANVSGRLASVSGRLPGITAGFAKVTASLCMLVSMGMLLSGCTPNVLKQTAHPEQQWQSYQIKLSQITSWHMEGFFGVKTANQAVSGNIDWIHTPEEDRFTFYGPLGVDETRLIIQADGASQIIFHNGRIERASNPERLMEQTMGWSLPVSRLRRSILGLPTEVLRGSSDTLQRSLPLGAQLRLNAYGMPETFTDQAFKMEYQQEEWSSAFGCPLPMDITVSSPHGWMKIAVSRWGKE
jgi:outer membrane lipoprotein LolB